MIPLRIRRVQNVLHVDKKGLLRRHNRRQIYRRCSIATNPPLDVSEKSLKCQ